MNQLASHFANMPATQIAPPPPQRAIPAALADLNRAQSRVTGSLSELMKRVQPVIRIEPQRGAEGVPPQGSTGCDLADQILSEANALDRAADTLNAIVSALEV